MGNAVLDRFFRIKRAQGHVHQGFGLDDVRG